MDNESGGRMIPTRQEILAALREARIELDCDTDEARAVLALEQVHMVREEVSQFAEKVDAGARHGQIAVAWIMARRSGDKHFIGELDRLMENVEGVRKRGH